MGGGGVYLERRGWDGRYGTSTYMRVCWSIIPELRTSSKLDRNQFPEG